MTEAYHRRCAISGEKTLPVLEAAHIKPYSMAQGPIGNESEYGLEGVKEQRDEYKLDSPDILAIKGLGQFRKFKQVATIRRLIEGWHVSDFQVHEARASQDAGYAEHISQTGENIPLVAHFMHEHYPEKFQEVLRKMEQRVPGVTSVEAAETLDGRIILRFQDGAFRDPFIARYVSDGSLKMFAYLLLLVIQILTRSFALKNQKTICILIC